MAKEKPNFMQFAPIPNNKKHIPEENNLEEAMISEVIEIKEKTKSSKLIMGKKQVVKNIKKPFPIYLTIELIEKIEVIEKKTGYSRNEVITQMLEFALDNIILDLDGRR